MELILTISYWSILAYNPALILDTRMAGKPTLLVDMGTHLFPAIFLSLNSLLTPPLEVSEGTALLVIAGMIGSYWMWVVVCQRVNGFWVYPFIGRLGAVERVLAMMAWGAIVWGAWCAVEWVKEIVEEAAKKSEKKKK
jgi:FAR-17a/AIG1-like protein